MHARSYNAMCLLRSGVDHGALWTYSLARRSPWIPTDMAANATIDDHVVKGHSLCTLSSMITVKGSRLGLVLTFSRATVRNTRESLGELKAATSKPRISHVSRTPLMHCTTRLTPTARTFAIHATKANNVESDGGSHNLEGML